jgi:hypothetical protein
MYFDQINPIVDLTRQREPDLSKRLTQNYPESENQISPNNSTTGDHKKEKEAPQKPNHLQKTIHITLNVELVKDNLTLVFRVLPHNLKPLTRTSNGQCLCLCSRQSVMLFNTSTFS